MFALLLYRNSSAIKQSKECFSQPNIPGLFPVLTPLKLLVLHQSSITQINELVGLSKSNFDRFYQEAIHRFARFVQQLPASEVHHNSGPGGNCSMYWKYV